MYGQEILSDILQDSWVSIKLKLHLSVIGCFRKKKEQMTSYSQAAFKKNKESTAPDFLTALLIARI